MNMQLFSCILFIFTEKPCLSPPAWNRWLAHSWDTFCMHAFHPTQTAGPYMPFLCHHPCTTCVASQMCLYPAYIVLVQALSFTHIVFRGAIVHEVAWQPCSPYHYSRLNMLGQMNDFPFSQKFSGKKKTLVQWLTGMPTLPDSPAFGPSGGQVHACCGGRLATLEVCTCAAVGPCACGCMGHTHVILVI